MQDKLQFMQNQYIGQFSKILLKRSSLTLPYKTAGYDSSKTEQNKPAGGDIVAIALLCVSIAAIMKISRLLHVIIAIQSVANLNFNKEQEKPW